MKVHEAIVRGLESVGVDTAFGRNGKNVASPMVVLKHSRRIKERFRGE
jgi:acetolactate synthase I/II/III large subunit